MRRLVSAHHLFIELRLQPGIVYHERRAWAKAHVSRPECRSSMRRGLQLAYGTAYGAMTRSGIVAIVGRLRSPTLR